jgi:hypothetical protein
MIGRKLFASFVSGFMVTLHGGTMFLKIIERRKKFKNNHTSIVTFVVRGNEHSGLQIGILKIILSMIG